MNSEGSDCLEWYLGKNPQRDGEQDYKLDSPNGVVVNADTLKNPHLQHTENTVT